MKAWKRILLSAAALFLGLMILLPGGAWWLLATTAGNGVLIDRVGPLIGATLSVGQRSGNITGQLEWRDMVYEDALVRVTVARIVLDWSPTRLLDHLVSVKDLSVERVEVHLKPDTAPPKPESDKPPLTRLPVNIDAAHVAVKDFKLWLVDAKEPIAVPAASLVASWTGSDLKITDLSADYPAVGHAQLSGAATLTEKGVKLAQLKLLAPVTVNAQGFVGYKTDTDLALDWRDLRWPMPGVAGAPADAAAIVTSAQGQGHVRGAWTDVAFDLDAALGDRGHVQADGRWDGKLDARAQWTQLTWPLVMPPAPAPPANAKTPVPKPEPPYQSASGKIAVKGLPESYAFDLDAELLAQKQSGHVQARGAGSTQAMDLERLLLTVGKAEMSAAGKLAWAPQPSGALKGAIQHVDPGLFAAAWPGDLNGEFTVEGQAAQDGSDPALVFGLKLQDSKLRSYPLKLDTQGRYAKNLIDIDSLELVSGGSKLTASGHASEPYDLHAELTSSNLAELAPGLAGRATASARFRGTLEQPHLVAKADLTHASYAGNSLDTLKLDADLDWNGPLALNLDAREITAGVRIQELLLKGSGTLGNNRLDLSAQSEQATVTLALTGGWDGSKSRWQGQIADSAIDAKNLAVWKLAEPAPLMLSARQNDLGPACWASQPGRVCLEAHQAPDTLKANAQLSDLAIASFKAFLPPDLKVEGALSGQASVDMAGGVVRELKADLSTGVGALQYQDRRFGLQPAHLALTDTPQGGHAEIKLPLDVGGVEGEAQIAPGTAFAERGLGGQIRLDFPDLAFLSAFTSEISSISGKLAGQYTLGGRLGAPQFQGEARLTDGKLKLARPGIELTDFTALVAGTPEGEVRLDATANSGGGTIKIESHVVNTPLAVEPISGSAGPTGKAAVAAAQKETEAEKTAPKANANAQASDSPNITPSAQPPPPTAIPPENTQGLKLWVQVDGENFQVAKLPQASVWVSPSLRFTLSGNQASFKGVLRVPKADVQLKQTEDTGVGPSSDQVIVDASGQAPERVQSLLLGTEVRVELGKDVKLAGYGLTTRLAGAITAVEQPGRDPIAYGELRLEDGKYKAYGQDLNIETGKLLYSGGPVDKPGLEVRATRKPTDDVTVGIYVRGTLEKPQLTLYSDPTMTQQQQLSWLLLGQPMDTGTSSSSSGASTQQRSALSGAAMALGLGGGSLLASNFQKGLGLDQISFGADPGESQEQARFTVGKYISPKIFVSYGIGLFQPGQVFKLLYDLGKGFKLSTESGTYTGGDLLYSVETR